MALGDIGRMGLDMKALGLEGRGMEEAELESKVSELDSEEMSMYEEMAPQGSFSKGALNSLVGSYNRVGKLFGIDGYPSFDADQKSFPAEFVKGIMMVITAASDALDEEVITSNMLPSIENISGDTDVAMLSAKLDMLGASKDFKRFLQEEAPEMEEEVMEEEVKEEGLSDEEMDKLFSSRM